MRPMRRNAASGKLGVTLASPNLARRSLVGPKLVGSQLVGPQLVGKALVSTALTGSAVLGLGIAAAAVSGPALAATASTPGSAVAFASPSTVTPGTSVTFQVTCGSVQATSATLFGVTLGLPQQIPMDKVSSGGVFSITVTLPGSIRPGTFNPAIDCSDGSSATARVRVTAMPSGGAQTGDGTTSTATNTGVSAVGLGLIAVGAVAGGIALRRRSGTRS